MRQTKDIEDWLRSAEITIDRQADARVFARIRQAHSTSVEPYGGGRFRDAVVGRAGRRWAVAAALVLVGGAAVYVSVRHGAGQEDVRESAATTSPDTVAVAPVLSDPRPGEVRLVNDLDGVQRNGRILENGLVEVGSERGLMWPYRGGTRLEFRREGPLVLLRVDDGSQVVAGLMIEASVPPAELDAAARDALDDNLALWCFGRPPDGIARLECADRITFFQQAGPVEPDDLTVPAGLVSLEAVYVGSVRPDGAAVTDLAVLSRLDRLKSLTLHNCGTLSDLAPLRTLRQLEFLDLTNCTGVRNIEPLGELASLRKLNLGGCTRVSDLTPLAGLGRLKTLYIRDCPGVSNIQPVRSLLGSGTALYASADLEAQASDIRREILTEYAMAASAIVRAEVSVSDQILVFPDKTVRVTKVMYGDVAAGVVGSSFSISVSMGGVDLPPPPAEDTILFLAARPQGGQYSVIHRVSGEPPILQECEQIVQEALKGRRPEPIRVQ